MAEGTRISVEQYFRTPMDGECELVDGEVRPKPMGTLKHSRLRARLRDALRLYEQAGKGEAIAEMSPRMGESVPIPDFLFSQSGQQADANDVFDTHHRNSASRSFRPHNPSVSYTQNAYATFVGVWRLAGSLILSAAWLGRRIRVRSLVRFNRQIL